MWKEFDNEKSELLKSTVILHKSVKIHYANFYGAIRERIVQPCKLAYKAKAWYLNAPCTEKQELADIQIKSHFRFSNPKRMFSSSEFSGIN